MSKVYNEKRELGKFYNHRTDERQERERRNTTHTLPTELV